MIPVPVAWQVRAMAGKWQENAQHLRVTGARTQRFLTKKGVKNAENEKKSKKKEFFCAIIGAN